MTRGDTPTPALPRKRERERASVVEATRLTSPDSTAPCPLQPGSRQIAAPPRPACRDA
jgi:hypothetical protein